MTYHPQRTLTDHLLLVLADLADWHWRVNSWSRCLAALNGDPRWRQHRYEVAALLQRRAGRRRLRTAFYTLRRSGFVPSNSRGNQTGFLLTPRGTERLLQLRVIDAPRQILPQRQWLMVFFDIPEVQRPRRDRFRRLLLNLDFQSLQKSIWITRRDVAVHLHRIIREWRLQPYVKLLFVKEFFASQPVGQRR